MTDREIMQQALKAMEYADACLKKQLTTKTKHGHAQDLLMDAGVALRDRLAQPEQEPRCAVIVEVFGKDWRLDYMSLPVGKHRLYTQEYVYTTPPAAQPAMFGPMGTVGALFDKHVIGRLDKSWRVYVEKNT
jgi:hypothetical protein